ncbi:MAG TPA: anti-sigma factor [Longimicrobiaceae bacterium]|jgi:anti-sigma factor RsiW|nr:anti-sigma factor [Longimicrobiaceae bacterium]
MMHAGEGTLQALLDGELPATERAEVERHLAECAACSAELRALRALELRFAAALARDPVHARTEAALGSVRARRAPSRWAGDARRALLKAAVLVLGVAGAAAAAVPGSPVRRWIGSIAAPRVVEKPAAPAAPAVSAPRARPPAGVSILPDGGAVRVVLTASDPALRVRTRVSEESMVEVRASGEAAAGRFRTGPGRIEVVGAGPGEIVVDLPRSLQTAVVEANGRVLVSREKGRQRVLAAAVESSANEQLFRAGP